MSEMESILNLGLHFGKMIRQVELALETLSLRRNQIEIEVSFIQTSLIAILDELEKMKHSEVRKKTIEDIKNYLTKLDSDFQESAKSAKSGKIRETIRKTLKKRKLKRKLKPEEINEINLNLQIWEDRFRNELMRNDE